MIKVNIEKLKKDSPSSSKVQKDKTPKKRGRKFAPTISRPSLPKAHTRVRFIIEFKEKIPSGEMKKLALVLPSYHQDNGFFDQSERTY
ncbi:hypothetical protein H5410_052045 [Solanum commersonii]|uniref:Uncharacterized protein n=1 Tax=Solanum commersonii TaxID=4109 RepID=A0A9J5X0A3_SOLCO|nr:hypothetical protein H5410_052045 [Solanum commersonii]